MAVDKNLPAILDDSAFTVHVRFQHSEGSTTYLYVSNIQSLKVGDVVVVSTSSPSRPAGEWLKEHLGELFPDRLDIAIVVQVDNEVLIDPGRQIKYTWIVSKLDLSYYNALSIRNKDIESKYASAYKLNMRRQFAAGIRASLPSDELEALQKLLGSNK